MNDLLLIGKIVYYLVFVFCLFLYAKYKYKNDRVKKFGLVAIIVFGMVFGIYGVICGPPGESIGDRHNYAWRFETVGQEEFTKNQSLGLYVIEVFLQLFTRDSAVLFFTISVLYFCINIYCYKNLKQATPFFLLVFFLSTMGIFGFYAIKQALSLAFVNLALTKYLQEKKVWAVVSLVIAILFHEAAWIVVLCFVLTKFCKGSKARQLIIYVLMAAIAVFFPQISRIFVSLFSHIPGMDGQIGSYLDDAGSIMIDMNVFTIIKSFPYYLISVIAVANRKSFRGKIDNYDFLMVLSVFCSIFSILSMYMYWMFRFAMYCYVPCFILVSQIAINVPEKNARILKATIAGTLLVLMIKVLAQYYFISGGIV